MRVDRSTQVLARPIAFAGMQGWLHQPNGPASDTGVVLVSPIGRDGRCAYMPMRLLADQLAAAGFLTLRYDHLGTGDSLDLDDEHADALPTWLAGVEQAIATLRGGHGVKRIVLGGVRFGATLAAASADQVDGLMLLAPILNGRSWLRRLSFATHVASTRAPKPGDLQQFDAGELCLSAATTASISGLDLAKLPQPKGPVFVASQNQLVKTYAAGMASRGIEMRQSDFPDFKDMFLESHSNLVPLATFEQAGRWLQSTFGPPTKTTARPRRVPDVPVLRPPGAIEQVVSFGANLQGVLCQPDPPVGAGQAVLFCSTGGDARAGVGGFATHAARDLAQRGVASLRFDMAGLGDSPMPGDDPRCHVFETPREADMDAAIAFLGEQGHNEVTTFGVCAGAYHALHAAWRNPRVTGVFAVSPVKLVWRSGDTLTFGRYKNGRATGAYVKAIADPSAWREAMQRKVDVAAIVLTLVGRLRSRLAGWAMRWDPAAPLSQMERFARRGGRTCFLMGINDASLEETETYFGPDGARLRKLPNTTLDIQPELDHGLAGDDSRKIAADILMTWMTPARSERTATAPVSEARRALNVHAGRAGIA